MFHVQGGTFIYHVNDQLESWFDVATLSSLRFTQHLDEGGKIRQRDFEIFPERQVFVENQKPEQPSVSAPLDDASFLFFVRTFRSRLARRSRSIAISIPRAIPSLFTSSGGRASPCPRGRFGRSSFNS